MIQILVITILMDQIFLKLVFHSQTFTGSSIDGSLFFKFINKNSNFFNVDADGSKFEKTKLQKNNFTQTDLTGNLFKKSIILDNDFVESSMSELDLLIRIVMVISMYLLFMVLGEHVKKIS